MDMLEEAGRIGTGTRRNLLANSLALIVHGQPGPVEIGPGMDKARWRVPGKRQINGLVHLPLILPPVVAGLARWQ